MKTEPKQGVFKPTEKQRQAIKACGGPQRHTLGKGGARSGKTFLFTRNTCVRALKSENSRHLIVRQHANACHRSVRLDTYAKIMRDCFPAVKIEQHLQDGYDRYPNGSEVWFAGLDDKDRVEKILGMEFATIYFNECSQILYPSVLVVRTRLAQRIPGLKNRAYYDLNPTNTAHWTEREFVQKVNPLSRLPVPDPENFVYFEMNPVDNVQNIDPEFIKSLEAMPERYRKRFLEGKPIAEIEGALWTPDLLEELRIDEGPPEYDRIVVAVDPSGAMGEEDVRSDEIGIVVVGKRDNEGFLLEDATLKGPPETWGKMAVQMWRKWKADCIVGEGNFGGDMVRSTIHAVNSSVKFKRVTATRGKVVRAEPVSALYEMKKFHHVGNFPKLEDELILFTTNGYKGERSPNRADALVWAAHELLLENPDDGLIEFYKQWGLQLQEQQNGTRINSSAA